MGILDVTGLKKSYKKGFIPKRFKVLEGIDFSLPEGSVTGFLGGNGAGKTTTLKCVLGLSFPEQGEVTFFGDQKLSPKTKERIGFLPERPYFYEYLTGEEFLTFYGQLSNMKKSILKERINNLLKKVDLEFARQKKLKEYSKGMLQKIGVAQALVHDPEFVILDEPMSGLDPDGRYYLSEIIRDTAKEGKTVFFSSHLLHDAEKLCQRLVVLKKGLVSYQGEIQGFLDQVGDAFLVTYIASGKREVLRVETQSELQAEVKKLINNGAQIFEVRPDRNLEEAFIKLGLRGG